MLKRTFLALAISGVAFGGFGDAAHARELKLVDGVSVDSGLQKGFFRFARDLETLTEGRYTAKYYGGTLFSFGEITGALTQGLADVGFSTAGYSRGEFPVTNSVVDISYASDDPVVMAAALSEFSFSCKPCIDEYLAQNIVPLGYTAIGPYYMYTVPKVSNAQEFKGRKIRGFGPTSRWIEAMGGTAVTMSASEVFTAMNQGVLDGNTLTLGSLKSLSTGEVANYFLDIPVGVANGMGLFHTNRDLWLELSEEDRKAYVKAAAFGHATASVLYAQEEMEIYNKPETHGVERVEPADDLLELTRQFEVDELVTVADLNKNRFNVENVDENMKTFLALVDKWTDILAEVDAKDPEIVGQIFYDRIFSQLDLGTFD